MSEVMLVLPTNEGTDDDKPAEANEELEDDDDETRYMTSKPMRYQSGEQCCQQKNEQYGGADVTVYEESIESTHVPFDTFAYKRAGTCPSLSFRHTRPTPRRGHARKSILTVSASTLLSACALHMTRLHCRTRTIMTWKRTKPNWTTVSSMSLDRSLLVVLASTHNVLALAATSFLCISRTAPPLLMTADWASTAIPATATSTCVRLALFHDLLWRLYLELIRLVRRKLPILSPMPYFPSKDAPSLA